MASQNSVRRDATARLALVGTLAAVTLAGCGGDFNLRREIGLVGKGPDEFRVVSNERLDVPEQLPKSVDQLPEPQPGAPSLVEPTPVKDAQAVFNLQGKVQSDQASQSEQSLLAAANASSADPAIRDELAEDGSIIEENARLLDDLFGTDAASADTLDPDEEARRLAREAQKSKNPELVVPEDPEKKKNGG